MTEYGMGDEATIDEILDDVDTNRVSYILLSYSFLLGICYTALQFCSPFDKLRLWLGLVLQDGRINYEEFVAMMKKGETR